MMFFCCEFERIVYKRKENISDLSYRIILVRSLTDKPFMYPDKSQKHNRCLFWIVRT